MPTTYNDASTTYNQSTLSYTGDGGGVSSIPQVAAYIAFNTTSPYEVLPQWSEVTSYVRSINIRRGRTEDLQKFTAGTASITLDNNARLFDPFDTGLVTERTNLCPNPSFETSNASWSSAQGAFSRSTTYALQGSASLTTTMNSLTDSNVFAMPVGTVTYTTIGAYTASAWFFVPTGSTLAGRTITASFEGGTQTNTGGTSQPATLVANAWVRCSYTGRNFTSTSGTSPALVFRLSGTLSTAVGQAIYMDGCLVEQSSSLGTYFDGDTYGASDPTLTSSWNGTTNNSTSKMMSYRRRTNLIPNPSFEDAGVGTTGWTQTTNCTVSRTVAESYSGVASLQLVAGSTFGYSYVSTTAGQRIPVSSGMAYSFSFYVKATSGTPNARATINWYNSAGTYISQNLGTNTVTTTSWARRSVTATAPASAVTAELTLELPTSSNGNTVVFDAILLEQSSSVGDYFDGDTYASGVVGTGQTDWAGTLGNSTSYLTKFPLTSQLTTRKQIKIDATWDSQTYTIYRGFVSNWPVEWTDAGKDSTVTIECSDLLSLMTTETLPRDWSGIYNQANTLATHYYKCDDPNSATTVKDYISGGLDMSNTSTTTYANFFTAPKMGKGYISDCLFLPSYQSSRPYPTSPVGGVGMRVTLKGATTSGSSAQYSFGFQKGYVSCDVVVPNNAAPYATVKTAVNAEGYKWTFTQGYPQYDQPTFWYVYAYTTPWFLSFNCDIGYLNSPSTGVTGTFVGGTNATPLDKVYFQNCFVQECIVYDTPASNYYGTNDTAQQWGYGNVISAAVARFAMYLSYTRIPDTWKWIDDVIPTIQGNSMPAFNPTPSITQSFASYNSSITTGYNTDSYVTDTNTTADAMSELNRIVDAELGELFVTKDGILTFFKRDYPYRKTRSNTSQVTFNDLGTGVGYDKGSLRVYLDAYQVRNPVTVKYSGGGEVTVSDQKGITNNGNSSMSVDTSLSYRTATSNAAVYTGTYPNFVPYYFEPVKSATSQANYLANVYQEAKVRVDPFLVKGQENPSYDWPRILGLELLDRFTLVRTPSVGSSFTKDMLLQSIEHQITPSTWQTTINGSARYTNWFIIGKSLINGSDLLL